MESTANHSSRGYFCHQCNTTISHTSADYLCPHCNQGFIEKLSDGPSSSSSSSSYTDRNSENGEEFEHLPMVLDSFLNNLSSRVQVMLRREDGSSGNTSDSRPTSSNRRDASDSSGRSGLRRRPRTETYNLNPERILSEFFSMARNPHNDNGPVFLVSNPGDYAWGREGLDTIVTQLLNQMDSSGPPPLATEKIQELPFVKITEQQVSENIQCSVCWDSFRVTDNVRQLPCEHIYHDPCIVPWLQLHGTCPICRKLLSDENESRLGGFAQGGGLEALLSDMQRRQLFDRSRYHRRHNTRCFRCSELGHIARDCPTRWNRWNRNRRQPNQNSHTNRRYEANWDTSVNDNDWGITNSANSWGTNIAPARSDGWINNFGFDEAWGITTNNDWEWGTPNLTVNWGRVTSRNDNSTNGGDTANFEFSIGLSGDDDDDDESNWVDVEDDDDCPSDFYSSCDDELDTADFLMENFGIYTDSHTGGSSTSATFGNTNTATRNNVGRNTRKNRNSQRCHNCYQPGHFIRDCPSKNRLRSNFPDNTVREHLERRQKCDVCSKLGHATNECWYGPTGYNSSRNNFSNRSTRPFRISENRSSVRNRPPTPSNRVPDNRSSDSFQLERNKYRNTRDSYNQIVNGHIDPRIPSTSRYSTQPDKSFPRNITCWNCNKIGHMARDCTVRKERRPCNICQSFGHQNGACREIVEF